VLAAGLAQADFARANAFSTRYENLLAQTRPAQASGETPLGNRGQARTLSYSKARECNTLKL
jgi:hypothetical protein